MSEHKIQIEWKRDSESFDYKSYTRDHTVAYGDSGSICASAAPDFLGNKNCLNPEQAFVTSMASCHMLTFLALASKKGFIVDRYADNAVAVLGRNDERKPAITNVKLAPFVRFSGEKVPSQEEYEKLHDQAHDLCFISNSVAQCVAVDVSPDMTAGQ
ncbi:MAG: OsmC family peroxiredoxin [Chitinivibrionales bacterium]|nr:OsmC family peroxiredoxin [Chitinivibrionales bacterium]